MMNTFGHSVWVFALVVVFFAQAYAQLADTMLCADESCTEAISEGEARLAYRPRDDNFLNLKKGDVVLVKSKNAGKKTHLWGGEEFLRKRRSPIPEDPYNDLVSPDKVVTDNEKQDVEKVESQQGSAQDVSTEEGRSPKEREESKKESHSDDSKVNSNEVQESDSDGGLPGKEENDSSMAQKVSIDDHKDSLAESGGHQVVQSSDKSIEDSMPADIAALLSSKNEGSESHKNIDTQQTVSQKTESNVQAEGHQYHSSEGESHEKKNKEEKDEAISEKKVDEANNEHADSATKEDDQYPTSQKESPEMKNNKEKDGVVSTESTHKSGVVSDESERDTDHHAQETEKNDGVEPDSVDDEKATTEHPNLVETDKTEDERKTENGEMMKAHNRTKHSNPITENVAKNDDVLSHKTAQETSHSVGDTADNNDGQDAKETHGDPDKTNQEMKKVDKEDIDEQIDEKSHKNEKGGDNKEKEPQKPAVKVDEEEDVDEQEEEKSHENEQKGGDNQEKEPQNPAEKVDEEEDIDEQEDGKYHKNEKETGDNREKEPQQPAVKVDEEEDVDEQEEKKSHENEQKAGDNQEKEPQKPAEQVDEEEDVHEQEEEKSHKKHKEAGDNQEKEPQKPAEQVDEEEDINEQEEEKSHKNEKEAGDNQEKEPEEPSVKMDEEQDVNEHEEENSYKNEEGRDSQEEDAKPENPVEKVNEKEGSDGPEKKEPRRNEEEGVDGREEEESQKSEPAGADGVEQEFKESEGLHADETPDDEENSVAGEVTESTLEDAAQKEQHMREDVTAESHDVKEKAQTENSGNADEMVGKKQETTEEKVVSQEKESTGESSTPEQAPADARKPDLEENVKKEGEVRSDPDGSEKSLEDKQLTVTEKSDDDTNAENVPNMSRKTDEGEEHNKSTKEREEENQVEMPQHEGQESLEGTDSQQTNARNITDHTAADEDGNEGVPSPDDVPEQHDEVHSKDATATTDETVLAEESIKKKASTQDAPVLQMDNAGAASNADEQLKDGDPDSYHALHEGKIVNWDEALDVDLEKKKTPGWDEVLGGGDEASQTEKEVTHESKISEGGESGHQDVTGETPHPEESVKSEGHHKEPGIEHEEDVATTPSPHQTLTPESSEHISNEMDKQDVTSQTSTTVTEVQKDPDTDQMPGAKPLPVPEMKDTVDKDAIEPSHTSTQDFVERPTAAIDKVEDAGTDNHTDGRDFHHGSEEEKSGQEFDTESELHVESIWLRLLIVLYNFPFDILYILEPFFLVWISLLPEEYQKDVYGVPWSIVLSTFFVGFFIIWLFICRSRSSKRRFKDEQSVKMIQELRTQLDNIIQEKLEKENELKTKQIELDLQRDEITNVNQEKFDVVTERTALQHSLREYSIQNDSFKRDIQLLNQQLQEKDNEMHEVLTNSDQVRKSLSAQQETISQYKDKLERLQSTITENESSKRRMEDSIEKYKERIKSLEIAKGETKKEGKTLKDQTEKLGQRIAELEKSLNAEKEEAELKRQEVDVLKDCILQFKGVQEYLNDEGEDAESEESIEKQKEKMRSMVDVSVVRNQLRQAEAEKVQITYELEAERKEKFETDGKVSELEATIQSDQAVKNKLEKDKQTLESKLTVMQEFYAKREVEIQSKLGMEQSRRESNATLLEDQQKQQLGLINQLDAYKKMSEDAKKQYEETERQHKQEILGFEKKSHENWLASRDAERKLDEANKQINQLHLELTDLQRRLRDREDREPILRPRPERHGPPGAPPPFGPPRRGPPPPGVPGSPLHFRNGPPSDVDRRSPPPMRRAPSPGNSINEEKLGRPDRPPSRPDRPPSAHSLPPMDRRPPSGPPMGHGPYPGPPPGRFGPYRGPPGARPPPPGGFGPRPMPGQRLGGAPMTSSPYMEQSPIPPTRSPGPHSQNFTQSSLHAPPPQMSGDSLRNEGLQPSPIGLNPAEPPPHATPSGRSSGGGNPFRRAR